MSDEGAFIRAFKAEMAALAHASLVETYTWANRPYYGAVPEDLQARGEAWAKRVEDAGATWDVLHALARPDEDDAA